MTEQEKEFQRLKIKVELMESYLKTVRELPILGPYTQDQYQSALDAALVKAGL